MVEDVLRAAPRPPGPAEARPLRRPWWSRVAPAHAVVLVSALFAGGLNLAVLRQGESRLPVLVAADDLPAGSTLEVAAVGAAAVDAPESMLSALIPADRLDTRAGWILDRPVAAGEPLRWTDLRDPGRADGLRSMSVPIEPEHAVAGALRRGDRVDVIAVRDGSALWVLHGVEVLDVGDPGRREGLGSLRPYSVTLAVDDEQSLQLAWALHDGGIEIVRATGAPPVRDPGALAGPPARPADEEPAP